MSISEEKWNSEPKVIRNIENQPVGKLDRSRSILLVEDEAVIAMHLEERLSSMGYRVNGIATTGQDAIGMAAQLRPDIVLMDIVLPGGMDGIEAATRIQQDLEIPVVFVTGFAGTRFLDRATRSLAYGYIVKPFQDKQIRASIELCLYRRDVERKLSVSILKDVSTVLAVTENVASKQSVSSRTGDSGFESGTMELNMVHNISRGLLALDNGGMIHACNPAGMRLLGIRSPGRMPFSIFDLLEPQEARNFRIAMDRISKGLSTREEVIIENHESSSDYRYLGFEITHLQFGDASGFALLVSDSTSEHSQRLMINLYTEILAMIHAPNRGDALYHNIAARIGQALELSSLSIFQAGERDFRFLGRWAPDDNAAKSLETLFNTCSGCGVNCLCRNAALGRNVFSRNEIVAMNSSQEIEQLRQRLLRRSSDCEKHERFRCMIQENLNSMALVPVRGSGGSRALMRLTAKLPGAFDSSVVAFLEQISSALADSMDRTLSEERDRRITRLESLGLLAGGIAHDFNNVLTVILGNLTMAEDLVVEAAEESSGITKCLQEARSATSRAAMMASQLLTFSKGGEPVMGCVEIGDIVETAMNFTTHGSKVSWETDIPSGIWPVQGDRNQLVHVINIIVLNSIQAMGDEGGRIRVRASAVHGLPREVALRLGPREGADLSRFVKIEFTDSGPGIDPAIVERIFEPYFTTRQSASGLGLAAAESIMRKHGGVICICEAGASDPAFPDSGSGAFTGACFCIFLQAGPARMEAKSSPVIEPETAANSRILIMDDEWAVLDIADRILSRRGYIVSRATCGEQAIEMYLSARAGGEKYDLVILDLTVPGAMGGRETMKKLREIDPDVRAVVSSGYSEDPVMANYQEYGFTGVIEKPYNASKLRDKVREYLSSVLMVVFFIFLMLSRSVMAAEGVFSYPDHAILARTAQGFKVTRGEFVQHLRSIDPKSISGKIDAEMLEKHLQIYLDEKILLDEARRRGLHLSDAFMGFRDEFKKSLMVAKLFEELKKEALQEPPATEEELRLARLKYQLNLAKYRRPMMTRIFSIVTDSRERADEAHQRLLKGDEFAKVAQDLSQASNASKGGDAGYIYPPEDPLAMERGQRVEGIFPKDIRARAFSMATGETSRVLQGSDGKWYIIRRGDNRKELNVPFESIGNALVFRIRYGKKSPALVRMERLSEKIRQILASASPDQGGELNSTEFLAYRRNRPYLQGADTDPDKSLIHGRPRQDMTLSAALEGAVDSQDSGDQNALLRQYRIRKALIDEALRRNIQAQENSTESYARAAANFLCISLLEDEFGKDFSSDPLNPASTGKASEFLKKLRDTASLKMDRDVFQDLVAGLDKFRRD